MTRATELLVGAVLRASSSSRFWAQRFVEHGFGPDGPASWDEFTRLPLMSKRDVLADQAVHPPFGSLLAVEPDDVRRVLRTSGTTDKPMLIALTERDATTAEAVAADIFTRAGVRPGLRVFHCLSFRMWSGGVTDFKGLERAGAAAIPYGVGDTSGLIEMMMRMKGSSISCTPSYLPIIASHATEMGIDARDLGIEYAFVGGEGLGANPAFRAAVESDFGLRLINANYGVSEVMSIMAGQLFDADPSHLTWGPSNDLFVEIVSDDGTSQTPEEGASGRLVVSTITREAQPVFRYDTGDLVRILESPSGSGGFVFSITGRADDMVTVKGVNIHASSIKTVLAEEGFGAAAAAVVVRPEPLSSDGNAGLVIVLDVQRMSDLPPAALKRLEARISKRVLVGARIVFADLNGVVSARPSRKLPAVAPWAELAPWIRPSPQ